MALGYKVSAIWGPPGTGKSLVLAMFIEYLVKHTDEQVVACALANMVVDFLLASCIKVARIFSPDAQLPFARMYSESQILAQWQVGETKTLNAPYHIDNLRHQVAQKNPTSWRSYLEGRQSLASFGSFTNMEERMLPLF